jgi:hypothetical protein
MRAPIFATTVFLAVTGVLAVRYIGSPERIVSMLGALGGTVLDLIARVASL